MAPSTKSARRLQHISYALATAPTAADAESSSGRVIAQISKGERGVPVHLVRQPTSFRPIHVARNGRLAPGEPQALQAALVEGGGDAASRKVWRGDVGWDDSERKGYTQGDSGLPTRTQELKQLLATFASPQLTLADCTPKGLAAQTEFFHEHGFVIIEDVIHGEALRQAQAAYAAAMVGPLRDWEAQAERGGGRRVDEEWFYLEPRKDMYVNVPLDYLNNPVLLDILDSPQLVPVVQSVMIESKDQDDRYVTCGLPDGRVVPVFEGEDGYCSWHRDQLPIGAWPYAVPRSVKAIFTFFDIAADGGPTAVVPRSHRLPEAPEQTVAESFTGGGQLTGELPLAAMPNNVRATCQAGSALLFNTATYHTAFPCMGCDPRRTTIIGYSVRRHSDGLAPPPPEGGALAELDAAGLLDRPSLRQVLHVPP